MTEKFLDKAYDLNTVEDTMALYKDWASSYDAEVADNGYATPGRVAEALKTYAPDLSAPLLDFGCGTGLSGVALKLAGFETVDGMDPSAEMLKGARAKKAYRTLTALDVNDATPVPQDAYSLITAIGVIGSGAAPVDVLHILMKALPQGGLLGLSLNDHTLTDPEFEAAINSWLDCGAARLLFKEHGPHLPARDIKSNVYIIEKA